MAMWRGSRPYQRAANPRPPAIVARFSYRAGLGALGGVRRSCRQSPRPAPRSAQDGPSRLYNTREAGLSGSRLRGARRSDSAEGDLRVARASPVLARRLQCIPPRADTVHALVIPFHHIDRCAQLLATRPAVCRRWLWGANLTHQAVMAPVALDSGHLRGLPVGGVHVASTPAAFDKEVPRRALVERGHQVIAVTPQCRHDALSAISQG